MKKAEKSEFGLKNHKEAWEKADVDFPRTKEMLQQMQVRHNIPLQTKEDVRFYVLMNRIRSIDAKLNNTVDDTYLQRIQDNILIAAEWFLK